MTLLQIGEAVALPRIPAVPPAFHIVNARRPVLLVVDGSRLYALENEDRSAILEDARLLAGAAPVPEVMPEPAALSLNIAQSCNLACHYCYADEGRFGGAAKLMSVETAEAAIRAHIERASASVVSVGFIGGEPLLNRTVLHAATRFAAREAASRKIAVTFGITTNATLLTRADLDLLRTYSFAVNVSMDGAQATHDALRPACNGSGSFESALRGIAPLLARPGKAKIGARVTVTRRNMDVNSHIEALAAAGFAEIGVSPLRSGPDPDLRIQGDDWDEYLRQLRRAAGEDWDRARTTGRTLRFSNFATALRQLYRGACNGLPCGAAASYVSLSADGRYSTCHRTVGDAEFDLGSVETGPSPERRRAFAEARAVDRQEPCRTCWARYLCGGGCHAEVMRMGREGCDSIRGWLEFCISLYPDVLDQRPDLLTQGRPTGVLP